jgi:hypothetical protein
MMSYWCTTSTDAYSAFSESKRRERESKMKNNPVPNLTGPYLSTGMELDQSEDIILPTISADIHELSLVAIAHKFVD